MRLLMVEDDRSITEMMELFFKKEGWDIEYVYDGKTAIETFKKDVQNFDIVTMDLNLPGIDGIQAAQEIKKISPDIPLIMLTARDSESDQIVGFEVGADDYVTKPFSPLALIARIKNIMKRIDSVNGNKSNTIDEFDLVTNHLKINSHTRETLYDDKEITGMTPKEFDLLFVLASSPKNVFTREDLLRKIWDYNFFGDDRTVDVHIKKLRKYFNDFDIQPIHTVWGVGYKFDDSVK